MATEILSRNSNDNIEIVTKSKAMLRMIKSVHKTKEDLKWIDTDYASEWKELLQILRNRHGKTTITVPKADDQENKTKFKDLIKKLKKKKQWDLRILHPPVLPQIDFAPKGAKLQSITQKVAYKLALQKNREDPITNRITANLEMAKEEVRKITGRKPTSEMIWKAISQIEPPRISDFIWKIATNRIKCGPWFANIPQWQDKQFCECGNVETMEHIIFECSKNNGNIAWNTIADIWEDVSEKEFKFPNLGILIGIGTVYIKTRHQHGRSKMYQNLVLLTAWCIWKTRNTRIFEERTVTPRETLELIGKTIALTIETDLTWAKDQKNIRKAANIEMKVRETWCDRNVIAGHKFWENKIKTNIRKRMVRDLEE
jgi:hypothetical protein